MSSIVGVGGGGIDPWTMTYVKIIIISVPVIFLESMAQVEDTIAKL